MQNRRGWPLEFRYYDMPQKSPVIALYGDKWKMAYSGRNIFHFHNALEVGICREGEGSLIFERETKHYRAGDISVIPQNIAHTTEGDYSWWEYLFIDADSYLDRLPWEADGREQIKEKVSGRALLLRREEHPGLWEAVDQAIREDREGKAYHREVMDSYVTGLLFLIARENQSLEGSLTSEFHRRDRKIRTALEYIEKHYHEELSIGDLAHTVNMSETHFRRVFREIMNMTPGDYRNMIRVRHACWMLTNTDQPVELIAEKAGFPTPSTFNRNFQRFLQTTPLKWRRERREEMGNRGLGVRVKAYPGWA